MEGNINFSRNVLTPTLFSLDFSPPPPVISYIDGFLPCWLRDCPLLLNEGVCEVFGMIGGTLWCWILWLIAGWPRVHVQPHRGNGSPDHAQGLCHSRVARQPGPPHVPGIYEVGRVCVFVFRGLEGSAGWGQCKDFCCFPCVLCPSAPWVLVSAVVLPVDLIWRDALPDSLVHPISSWLMVRTSPPVQSLLGPLSQLPFWLCPHCGYILCLSVSDQFPKHQPGHRWHRVKSLLCDLQMCKLSLGFWQCFHSCKCVRNKNSCIARPVLAPPDLGNGLLFVTLVHCEPLWKVPPCWSSRWSWRLWIQRWFLRSYCYNCHLLVGWESLLASCLVLK